MSGYSARHRLLRAWYALNRWSVYVWLIGGLVALPILTIAVKLWDGPGSIWSHVVEHLLFDYVSNSLWLSAGCILLTFLMGVSSAWCVTRYDFPGRKVFEWLLLLPLAIPSYITAYAYAGIFDFGGTLALLFKSIGWTAPRIDVMNIYGLILVLSSSLFPYVYISTRAAFLYQSKNLRDASRLLGASENTFIYRIALPLARPAIIGGLVLVLMEVLNDYGAAKYYGVPTFTTGIFRSWFALESLETAVYLAAILVVLVFGLLGIERWQRAGVSYVSGHGEGQKNWRQQPGAWGKAIVFLLVSIPALLGFVLPVLQLIYWAILTFADVIKPAFGLIILQSLGIAMLTALVTTGIAFLLIYFTKWSSLSSTRWISRTATLGYAIPGAVIALGVMVPTLAFDKWLLAFCKTQFGFSLGLLLNGTIIALVYAYAVRFLAVAYNPLEASTLKVGSHLSESAQLLGNSPWKALWKIEWPLVRTGFWSAAILVFVDVLKELPLTLILKPYGVQTLAVKAYEYASDERIAESALPALLIVLTGVIFALLFNKTIDR